MRHALDGNIFLSKYDLLETTHALSLCHEVTFFEHGGSQADFKPSRDLRRHFLLLICRD